MVIPSILVLCFASSTDAFDQVLDLPEVVVQPSLIPGLLAFDRSPSLAQSHIQLDPTDFQIDRSLPEVMQAFLGVLILPPCLGNMHQASCLLRPGSSLSE